MSQVSIIFTINKDKKTCFLACIWGGGVAISGTAQESLLAERGPYEMVVIEPGLAAGKASILSAVPWLACLLLKMNDFFMCALQVEKNIDIIMAKLK